MNKKAKKIRVIGSIALFILLSYSIVLIPFLLYRLIIIAILWVSIFAIGFFICDLNDSDQEEKQC